MSDVEDEDEEDSDEEDDEDNEKVEGDEDDTADAPAAPIPDPAQRRTILLLSGDLPSPKNPPSGCVFRTRCPQAESQCAQADMQLRAVGDGHLQACWKVKD